MRIFSSAEYCLRVARRMSRTSRSDGVSGVLDLGLMLHSSGGHDEPETLRPSSRQFCLTGADVGHIEADAEGNLGFAIHLRDGASKGSSGRIIPLNGDLRRALEALQRERSP